MVGKKNQLNALSVNFTANSKNILLDLAAFQIKWQHC